ncbi:MAG: alpha/beta hydrolase [Calditrichaceae bacterium]
MQLKKPLQQNFQITKRKGKKKQVILNILVTIIIIYCAYLVLLYFGQRALIFPGRSIGSKQFETEWISDDQINWIDTPEGKIETWFIPAPDSNSNQANPVVIFAHGNFELIDYCEIETHGLNHLGYDVFLIEYPGFGRSNGTTSRESINATYVAAYDWLISNKDIDPDQIIGFGRSLGGGAISDLAKKRSLAAVILQSTFANVQSFAKRYLAPAFLTRDPFDNVAALKNFTNPVLVIHGRQDALIPFWHGETLAKNIPQSEFIAFDCEHNDCPPDWDDYWQMIDQFIKSAARVTAN